MLISHQKKFIFVHIMKNAGQSIESALLPSSTHNALHLFLYRAYRRVARYTRIPVILPFRWHPQPMWHHVTAHQIRERVGAEMYDSYFSFAVVRNPWDWMVSRYHYTLKDKRHPAHQRVSRMKGFTEYMLWRCTPEHIGPSQKDFVFSPDGHSIVNFIIRYENLAQDFNEVCIRIGVEAALPRINVTKHRPYQELYTPDLVDLVRRTFAADIELFGYTFESQVG
jgi:hypothetical protein